MAKRFTFVDQFLQRPKVSTGLQLFTICIPFANSDGDFEICPIDKIGRKIASDFAELRKRAHENGLSEKDHEIIAREISAKWIAVLQTVGQGAALMRDVDAEQTLIAAKSEGEKGSGTVPSIDDLIETYLID